MLKRRFTTIITVLFAMFVMSGIAFAAPANTQALDTVIAWIATWAGRIGLVVAFFGGIQTALGFKNDDADAKVRGLKTLASGFMVFGISQSLDLFGL